MKSRENNFQDVNQLHCLVMTGEPKVLSSRRYHSESTAGASVAFVLIWGAAGAACHDQVRLNAPQWTDQRSYILAITVQNDTQLWAYDVSAGRPVPGPEFSTTGPVDLTAVHLGCSLSGLGLAAGPLRLRTIGAARAPLPPVLALQATRFDGESAAPWRPIDARQMPVSVAVALRRLDIERETTTCDGRTPQIIVRPSSTYDGAFSFALPLASDELLVGTRDGKSYLIDSNDQRITGVLPATFSAGYLADDSETLYLLREDGYLFRGQLDALEQITTSSVPMGLSNAHASLAGGRRGDGVLELFATTDGAIAHFAGDDWTILHGLETRGLVPPGRDIQWIGPGTALVADFGSDGTVYRIELGKEPQALPAADIEQTAAMQRTIDGELWLGGRDNSGFGVIYQYDHRDGWLPRFTDSRDRIATNFIHSDLGLFIGFSGDLAGGYQWAWALRDNLGTDVEPDTACDIEPEGLATVFYAWRISDRQWMTLNQEQSVFNPMFNTTQIEVRPADGEDCVLGSIRL
ncbi:MAG: hypothetical protein AAF449_10235 [Myxococcota bacterium]